MTDKDLLTKLDSQLTALKRQKKKELSRFQSKYAETPTNEIYSIVCTREGELIGIKKCQDLLNGTLQSEFDLGEM